MSVEAVEGKSMSAKRTATDGQVRPRRKRQKTEAHADDAHEELRKDEQTRDQTSSQVFRFMDLPGELRNHVYEYATEYAFRAFPVIMPKDKSRPKRGSPALPRIPILIPYIRLTQVSSLIRSEFRPAWLSSHKIPLCALTPYLKAFFPSKLPKASPEVQKLLRSQTTTVSSLRIWIRTDELKDAEITRLIRHVTRFPDARITFHALPSVPASTLYHLNMLVNNRHEKWVAEIRSHKITQVRVQDQTARIVVAERWAPQWMRPLAIGAPPSDEDELTEALGLAGLGLGWSVQYGIDYS